MEIVVLDSYSVNPGDISWGPIERFGHMTIYDHTPPEQIAQRLKDADVAYTNRGRLCEAEFAAAPKLRFLGVFATGYDKIDRVAAKRHGIAVCNVPGYSTYSVAQHAIALLLAITNRAAVLNTEIRKGRWTQKPGDCSWDAPILELYGKTFGVLGTGEIGCAAARMAQGFGMRVIGHSRSQRAAFPGEYVSLEELFTQSDVLSLHCAATEDTREIINKHSLALMKPSAILINTARGALVHSPDLAAALNESRLYAAGLDVCEAEPILPDSPLLFAKNCVITPHSAWIPQEARKRLIQISADNLEAFLNNRKQNRVDELE